jgi:hypothetical protein
MIAVWYDDRIGQQILPQHRKTRHDSRRRKPSVNLAESLLKVGQGESVQEHRVVVAGQGSGTVAVAGKRQKVSQGWWLGHRPDIRRVR